MGAFRDLAEVFELTPIELPIEGTVYAFPARIPAETGLLLAQVRAAAETDAETDLDGIENVTMEGLRVDLMGDSLTAMRAAAVPNVWIDHVLYTLMVWHMEGEDAAAVVWERRAPGEAAAPNRAGKRAAKKASARTRTAGASSTSRASSGSGTSTPKGKVRETRSRTSRGR